MRTLHYFPSREVLEILRTEGAASERLSQNSKLSIATFQGVCPTGQKNKVQGWYALALLPGLFSMPFRGWCRA